MGLRAGRIFTNDHPTRGIPLKITGGIFPKKLRWCNQVLETSGILTKKRAFGDTRALRLRPYWGEAHEAACRPSKSTLRRGLWPS